MRISIDQWYFFALAKHIPFHPCEKGWIEIYSTVKTVQLTADIVVNFEGPTVDVTCNGVSLQFKKVKIKIRSKRSFSPSTLTFIRQDDIEVFVQCTQIVCWIPPSDIAKVVANEFVSVFTRWHSICQRSESRQEKVFVWLFCWLSYPGPLTLFRLTFSSKRSQKCNQRCLERIPQQNVLLYWSQATSLDPCTSRRYSNLSRI